MEPVFTIEQLRPVRDGLTVSRALPLGRTAVTLFSLGKGTGISAESYDRPTLYIGAAGNGTLSVGQESDRLSLPPDHILIIPGKTLCGMDAGDGFIYTEIILEEKELHMNDRIRTNEVFALKELIDYEEGSITNLDIVGSPAMKYVLMAFDEGTGLTPHRAPGNAIVFALEGKATIGYEGTDYELSEGECFRFEKNGLHSVTANGRFKMALLLVIE